MKSFWTSTIRKAAIGLTIYNNNNNKNTIFIIRYVKKKIVSLILREVCNHLWNKQFYGYQARELLKIDSDKVFRPVDSNQITEIENDMLFDITLTSSSQRCEAGYLEILMLNTCGIIFPDVFRPDISL